MELGLSRAAAQAVLKFCFVFTPSHLPLWGSPLRKSQHCLITAVPHSWCAGIKTSRGWHSTCVSSAVCLNCPLVFVPSVHCFSSLLFLNGLDWEEEFLHAAFSSQVIRCFSFTKKKKPISWQHEGCIYLLPSLLPLCVHFFLKGRQKLPFPIVPPSLQLAPPALSPYADGLSVSRLGCVGGFSIWFIFK